MLVWLEDDHHIQAKYLKLYLMVMLEHSLVKDNGMTIASNGGLSSEMCNKETSPPNLHLFPFVKNCKYVHQVISFLSARLIQKYLTSNLVFT